MKLGAVLCALAFVIAPGSAAAFCRSTSCAGECARDDNNCKSLGAPLYWPSLCVGFSLSNVGSANIAFAVFQDIAIRSIASWSSLACPKGEASVAFVASPAVSCHTAEYNLDGANANIILFQDSKWAYKSADNTLAKTTVTFDSVSGEILDADIEINHAYNEITTGDAKVGYDLQSILTHEFGHFIGLDHSLDFDATMNASYDPGTVELRTPEEDDIGGVCTIYPPGRAGTCNPAPHGGFSDACHLVAEESACALGRPGHDGHRQTGKAFACLTALALLRRCSLRRRTGSR